jgi:hypothetical protein
MVLSQGDVSTRPASNSSQPDAQPRIAVHYKQAGKEADCFALGHCAIQNWPDSREPTKLHQLRISRKAVEPMQLRLE